WAAWMVPRSRRALPELLGDLLLHPRLSARHERPHLIGEARQPRSSLEERIPINAPPLTQRGHPREVNLELLAARLVHEPGRRTEERPHDPLERAAMLDRRRHDRARH